MRKELESILARLEAPAAGELWQRYVRPPYDVPAGMLPPAVEDLAYTLRSEAARGTPGLVDRFRTLGDPRAVPRDDRPWETLTLTEKLRPTVEGRLYDEWRADPGAFRTEPWPGYDELTDDDIDAITRSYQDWRQRWFLTPAATLVARGEVRCAAIVPHGATEAFP